MTDKPHRKIALLAYVDPDVYEGMSDNDIAELIDQVVVVREGVEGVIGLEVDPAR